MYCMEHNMRVCGIPATVMVITVDPMEWEVFVKGKKAPWLERKINKQENERIDYIIQELYDENFAR